MQSHMYSRLLHQNTWVHLLSNIAQTKGNRPYNSNFLRIKSEVAEQTKTRKYKESRRLKENAKCRIFSLFCTGLLKCSHQQSQPLAISHKHGKRNRMLKSAIQCSYRRSQNLSLRVPIISKVFINKETLKLTHSSIVLLLLTYFLFAFGFGTFKFLDLQFQILGTYNFVKFSDFLNLPSVDIILKRTMT